MKLLTQMPGMLRLFLRAKGTNEAILGKSCLIIPNCCLRPCLFFSAKRLTHHFKIGLMNKNQMISIEVVLINCQSALSEETKKNWNERVIMSSPTNKMIAKLFCFFGCFKFLKSSVPYSLIMAPNSDALLFIQLGI